MIPRVAGSSPVYHPTFPRQQSRNALMNLPPFHFGLLAFLVIPGPGLKATEVNERVKATNALGINLLTAADALGMEDVNPVFSPYSLQLALAMAYLGARGGTREEMGRALGLPAENAPLLEGIAALATRLRTETVDQHVAHGKEGEPASEEENGTTVNVTNRLFVQADFSILPEYAAAVEAAFGVSPTLLDFVEEPTAAAAFINEWVADATLGRIPAIVGPGDLSEDTRAFLANAVYFQAAWLHAFEEEATAYRPFWVKGASREEVRTMRLTAYLGYRRERNREVITLPYSCGQYQFVLVLPSSRRALGRVRDRLKGEFFENVRFLPDDQEIVLYLPSFEIGPTQLNLTDLLQKKGVRAAFDKPPGSADFSGIAPVRPDAYLSIGRVAQATFFKIDEQGTEGAAASGIHMLLSFGGGQRPQPRIVRADRPFLYAVQHIPTGTLLFIGEINDPR